MLSRSTSLAVSLVLALAAATPAMARGGGGGHGGGHLSGTGSNPSSHSVQGYTTRNGTTVAPHQQTNPNGTMRDNYGARGNVNPYTGEVGRQYVPR